MKKGVLLSLLILFSLVYVVSAADLSITTTDKGSVVISELNNPAVFDFRITNFGADDNFEIYSFTGVDFSPKGMFELPSGTTNMEVKAYPDEQLRKNAGFYKFEYQIKGQNSGIYKDFLTIKIVKLQDVLGVEANSLLPSDSDAVITLRNRENTNIENVTIRLVSDFFDVQKVVSFEPYGNVTMNVPVDKEKSKGLFAGKYDLTAEVNLENAQAKKIGVIDYLEGNGISVDKSNSGIIVRKTTVTKTNEGNVPASAEIDISKDVLSRLFTVYSLSPMQSNRSGLTVNYIWAQSLNPGESYSVIATTNYTIPLILLILIVVVIVFAKVYSLQTIDLEKRVSYVRTKSGQFALKVTLHVKARKHTDNIQIIDKLPEMTKIYEKYGKMPDRIDHSTKRLFWDIPKLNAGEERVFSYIIYSGLNIVGRFELPAATVVFEQEGKTQELHSNRAFFAVDTHIRKE